MRAPWWEKCVDWVWRNFAHVLFGITADDWSKLLQENQYAIEVPYWHRALSITLHSIHNSVQRKRERHWFDAALAKTAILPPLFILGHWRNGTTHLHNLLALDPQFAFANSYQVLFPHTFLSTEAAASPLMAYGLPERRPQDNVRMAMDAPAEDEFALNTLTGRSIYAGWIFPRREEHYDRYLTSAGIPEQELKVWKAAFVWFLKKLTWKYHRPLVLKSPPHTGRIRLLLEMFPDARFVHIHRNPYIVFQSSQLTRRAIAPIFNLQRPDWRHQDHRILHCYRLMYDAFFEERKLIPADRFHELAFEDLERDPLGQMEILYQRLGLVGFETLRPAFELYLASLAGYRKNTFPEPRPDLRRQIAVAWQRNFEEWRYQV